MFYEHLKGHVEALLFASGDPLPPSRIAEILEVPVEHIDHLLSEIDADLQAETRGLTLVEVAGGFQLCTKPELAGVINKLAKVQDSRLSPAALETLAIIAFKQPVTRQEIESIRGVSVDGVVGTLTERGVIKEVGRKDAVGRPILYGTTDAFLQCMGLKSLQELPPLPEFVLEQEQKKE